MALALPTPRTDSADIEHVDVFNDHGSVYSLVSDSWAKLGHGLITMTSNPHRPKELIFKLAPDGSTELHVFQIKPKLKAKGPMSWVIKGLNVKTKTDQILAVRFHSEPVSGRFQEEVDKAAKATVTRAVLKRQVTEMLHMDDLIKRAPKKEWDCEICTAHNEAVAKKCQICHTTRPLHTLRISESWELSLRDVAGLPRTPCADTSPSGSFEFEFSFPESSVSRGPPSPSSSAMSEKAESVAEFEAATGLKERPSDDDRVRTTELDFSRILNYVDAHLVDRSAGAKLYEDLRKVAKRLLRDELKFRTLDRRNPVVRKRLLDVAGVEAYVKYLGFITNSDGTKMVCPRGEPAKSIIKAAMAVCNEFRQRSTEYKQTMARAHRESRMVSKEALLAARMGLSSASAAAALKHMAAEGKDAEIEDEEDDAFTLKEMIRSVTNASSKDSKTKDVILLCHKAYASSLDLLQCLVERYKEAESAMDWSAQLKVGEMLRQWIREFYVLDFDKQPECLDELDEFLEYIESGGDSEAAMLAKSITATLDQKEKELDDMEYAAEHRSRADLAGRLTHVSEFKLLETDPRVLAEQITLSDFDLFCEIKRRECLGQGWKKREREVLAPNILRFIGNFNEVSKWVKLLILNAKTYKLRVLTLKHVLKILNHLMDLRNYSSCCAFQAALESAAIHRQKKCWEQISERKLESYMEIKSAFDHSGGYRTLRKLQSESPTPSILHIGLVLQDIVFIDEGVGDRTGGRINFSKLTRLYETIERLATYQSEPYPFAKDPIIQQSLAKDINDQMDVDDEEIYERSTRIRTADGS